MTASEHQLDILLFITGIINAASSPGNLPVLYICYLCFTIVFGMYLSVIHLASMVRVDC